MNEYLHNDMAVAKWARDTFNDSREWTKAKDQAFAWGWTMGALCSFMSCAAGYLIFH